MIGPVLDYCHMYAAACGQTFSNYSLGVSHERECMACKSAIARDQNEGLDDPDERTKEAP